MVKFSKDKKQVSVSAAIGVSHAIYSLPERRRRARLVRDMTLISPGTYVIMPRSVSESSIAMNDER